MDSVTCNICKTLFIDEDSKILCCDRCELWDLEGRIWADIIEVPETRTIEEVIEKLLMERDNEEKERQNRRRYIIVFELPESKKPEPEDRKEHWTLRSS